MGPNYKIATKSEMSGMVNENLGFARKQTFRLQNGSNVDRLVARLLEELSYKSAMNLRKSIEMVNSEAYQLKKQQVANEDARAKGLPLMATTIDEFEYLYIMEETELDEVVRAMLPIVKVDAEKNKYMIGTVCHVVQVKTDRLLIRVGGGY